MMHLPHFPESIIVSDQEIDCAHFPEDQQQFVDDLAREIHDVYVKSGKGRKIVGIAGPSGAGKSVLAELLCLRIGQLGTSFECVTVSIDAYHFRNSELKETIGEDGVPLSARKGRYDTYDVRALVACLKDFCAGVTVRFPLYSRVQHEPREGAVDVSSPDTLLILEGLWVSHDTNGWTEVGDLLLTSYYLDANAEVSREQTISRHERGGRSRSDAEAFYRDSDEKNVRIVEASQSRTSRSIRWPK